MLHLFFILFTLFSITSCSNLLEEEEEKKCTPIFNCTSTESKVECPVEVHITNSETLPIQVDFFVGEVETGSHFSKIFLENSSKIIQVDCGQYISAKATYNVQNKNNEALTLEAIDGGEADASKETDCDGKTCYSSPFGELDLDLKIDLTLIPSLK
jgi:hypothetical protein